MKKKIALGLTLAFAVLTLAGCAGGGSSSQPDSTPVESTPVESTPVESEPAGDDVPGDVTVMTHEEYMAAELETPVMVETYVQAHQSWWNDQITIYAQSPDGAYFIYNAACSEEDAAKLEPGTPIRVTGYKAEWSGEVEIVDATIEILEGDTYVAEPVDVTDLLGTDELINHQNEKVLFKGLTIESVTYKNNEPGDDIYVTVGYNGETYNFCVEYYLTNEESDVYVQIGQLYDYYGMLGELTDENKMVVDIEGFLYWYEGVNTHITSAVVAMG